MKRNQFQPYTKAEVARILQRYFSLTHEGAEMNIKCLVVCMERDHVDVVKYLKKWDTELRAGRCGRINELYALYPQSQPWMALP